MNNRDVLPKTAKLRMPALTQHEIAQYGPEVINACPIGIQTFLVIPKTTEEMNGTSASSV